MRCSTSKLSSSSTTCSRRPSATPWSCSRFCCGDRCCAASPLSIATWLGWTRRGGGSSPIWRSRKEIFCSGFSSRWIPSGCVGRAWGNRGRWLEKPSCRIEIAACLGWSFSDWFIRTHCQSWFAFARGVTCFGSLPWVGSLSSCG